METPLDSADLFGLGWLQGSCPPLVLDYRTWPLQVLLEKSRGEKKEIAQKWPLLICRLYRLVQSDKQAYLWDMMEWEKSLWAQTSWSCRPSLEGNHLKGGIEVLFNVSFIAEQFPKAMSKILKCMQNNRFRDYLRYLWLCLILVKRCVANQIGADDMFLLLDKPKI